MEKIIAFNKYLDTFTCKHNYNLLKIPNKEKNRYGSKYYITDWKKFLLYYGDIVNEFKKITNENMKDMLYFSLVQAPQEPAIIKIDVDLKRKLTDIELSTNIYPKLATDNVINIICQTYSQVLVDMYKEQVNDANFYILTRPNSSIEVFNNTKMLKDGIHIYIPEIVVSFAELEYINTRVNNCLKYQLKEYKNPIDTAVNKNSGIVLYGSSKNGENLYDISKILSVQDLKKVDIKFDDKFKQNLPYKLSIHQKPNKSILMNKEIENEIKMKLADVQQSSSFSETNIDYTDDDIKLYWDILNSLAQKRYDDYEYWSKIGWCLAGATNHDIRFKELWIKFSKKCIKYNESMAMRIWEKSRDETSSKNHYKTFNLLYEYLKEDVTKEVYEELCNRDISRCLMNIKHELTDADIADIMAKTLQKNYKSVINGNEVIFYEFKNHIWKKCESHANIVQYLRTKFTKIVKHVWNIVFNNKVKAAVEESGDVKKYEIKEKQLRKILLKIGNSSSQSGVIKAFAYHKDICIEGFLSKLNKKIHLMAFNNGVLDTSKDVYENGVFDYNTKGRLIHKGYFRPGDPQDYISRQSPVDFKYLDEFNEKEILELKEYLHQIHPIVECADCNKKTCNDCGHCIFNNACDKCYKHKHHIEDDICQLCKGRNIGYYLSDYFIEQVSMSIVGNLTDSVLYICKGRGGNGKSTVFQLIVDSFGLDEYANNFNISVLTDKEGRANQHSTHMTDFIDVRFIMTSEPDIDAVFNTHALKKLTGNDIINLRVAYGKYTVKIMPQYRMWLMSNNHIRLKTIDDAVSRRMVIIPFPSKFIKLTDDIDKKKNKYDYVFRQDPHIKDKINSWINTGLFMSYLCDIYFNKVRGKIVEQPRCIIKESKEYIDSYDHVQHFCDDKLVDTNSSDDRISYDILYEEFMNYMKERHLIKNIIDKTTFIESLKQIYGNRSFKIPNKMSYISISLKIAPDISISSKKIVET